MKELTRSQLLDLLDASPNMKKGLALPSTVRNDSMALPVATSVKDTIPGGLWIVPLFERFPHLVEPLELGVVTEAVVLMIDLSPFSVNTNSMNAAAIKALLDRFYARAVSAIESNGGVVDRFVGDGIIAVFGHPFRSPDRECVATCDKDLAASFMAAANVIMWANGLPSQIPAKAAIAKGKVFIGWVGPPQYRDLTVIGNPMTELSRLEDMADVNQILIQDHNWDALNQYLRERVLLCRGSWTTSHESKVLRGISGLRSIARMQYVPA